jgi:hypothetical protein
MIMKKIFNISAIFGLFLFLASCSITRPYAVTNNPVGESVGVSSTILIFGSSSGVNLQTALFSTNSKFGVIEAARNGNIHKVGSVDVKTSTYLFGIITKVEVIVTGTEEND